MKYGWLVLAFALCGILSAETNPVIRTAAELLGVVSHKGLPGKPFDLCVTALSTPPDRRHSFYAMDGTGGVPIFDIRPTDDPHFAPGDRLRVSGLIEPRHSKTPEDRLLNANCTNVVVLAHGKLPEPIPITAADIERNDLIFLPVHVSGILIGTRMDEIDPQYIQFVIDCSNRMVFAAANIKHFQDPADSVKQLVGATIAFDGILSAHSGSRIHCRRYIALQGAQSLRMLKPPSDDLFRAPAVGDTERLSPEAIVALGRRRAEGRVLAVWNGNTLLMRTASGEPMKAGVITAPPTVGDCIEAVGYAETDLFHVNLSSVIWRKAAAALPPPTEPILAVKARDLLVDKDGNRKFDVTYHGKNVRLNGVVQDFTSDGQSGRRIILAEDGYSIAVDCSSAPTAADGLEIGSTVSVTGVCIVDTEAWNRHAILPLTRGIFIALCAPSDITVLAHPPWWTPFKLMVVIGVLLLLLVAILIWNASLRILSERRGREMYRSQIAQAKAEMKTDERTRLAAELHDHLAQNLTAISYQIAAAERSRTVDTAASAHHLDTASRMLGSCRTELRRCLWDLRSDALDEADVNLAIRKSIEPIAGNANVHVEVNAPRAKLSDSSLHATLSIIRELAANAVNHGQAKNLRITGELAHGTLQLSVTDDGCGFDTEKAPGMDEGHFGLGGVRERVRRHNGEMSIESAPGKGTSISVTLNAQPLT